jgi:hypothetical protein
MTPVERDAFAAVVRESFLEVASKTWEARGLGFTEEQVLIVIAGATEPVVQALVRAAERGVA